MRNQEWNAALAQLHPLDLAQLVLCLLFRDAVDGEAALGIVDEAEVLASLLDTDHVHEAGWVGWVGAHFTIDFDEALHDDCFGFAGIEGVFEALRGEVLVSIIFERSFQCQYCAAYRFRMKTIKGMQSLNLCGPGLALGA